MRKILYIALFSVLAVSAKAQIPINTFFDVSTPNPIDGRFVIPTLADTSTITDLYDGLLTVVQNTDQLWQYDGTKWVQFQTGSSDNIYTANGTISTNRTVTVGSGNSLNITTQNGDGQIYMEDGVGLQLGGNTSTPGGRETVNFPDVGGGLQYGADYSGRNGFGDRTIPDWGYISSHTVDTLSTLADTTAAANNVGRIAHVVSEDEKWTVNSAGFWEALSGGAGGGTDEYYTLSSTSPDTSLLWIDATTWDSTTVFEVKDYIGAGWEKIGYIDTLNYYFSNQSPIYLVNTGQSNSTPRGEGGPIDTLGGNNMSIYDPLEDAWTAVNTQDGWYGSTANNWYPIHFAAAADELDSRIVKVVHAGRGGRPIDDWLTLENSNGSTYLPDPSGQWDTLTTRIAASKIPRIDCITWYQGETDGILGRNDRQYGEDFYKVMAQFEALDQFESTTKLIAVQLLPDTTALNDTDELTRWDQANGFLQFLNEDQLDWTFTIANKREYAGADGIHISAAAHIEIGKKLYAAYTGREDYSLRRYAAQGQNVDSVIVDFRNSTVYLDDSVSQVMGYAGTWGEWNGNAWFADDTGDGITFNEGFLFCISDTGKVQLGTVFDNHASSAWLQTDTLFLSVCPANSDALLPGPLEVGGSVAWYDASQQPNLVDGQNSAVMTDFSGNNRTMNAGTDGADWFEDCDGNGNPCFNFNGVNEFYEYDADTSFRFLYKTESTIFAVYSNEKRDTLRSLWGGGYASTYDGYSFYVSQNGRLNLLMGGNSVVAGTNTNTLPNDTLGVLRVLAVSADPDNAVAADRFPLSEIDGNFQFGNNAQLNQPDYNATVDLLRIGNDAQNNLNISLPWKGDLYELVIFDRVLTSSEVTLMYNYLERKYSKKLN